MAELIRQFDWGRTPLGAIDTWSGILVTTLNLLLASRHPMFLWWGPDLIQFYNDGYRGNIGLDKHPSAVGQRGIDCWPEIWPTISPQIKAVMETGASTWNTNQLIPIRRDGKLEEVFWTYSYSPVRNDEGKVEGVLVVCTDTTENVLSERRQRALLAITADTKTHDRLSEPRPLLNLAKEVVERLEADPSDLPFAALYLVMQGEIKLAGNTTSTNNLTDPTFWPLAQAVETQLPVLQEDIHLRFDNLVLPPWPEPITRAYVVPFDMPGSAVQAVLVLGISPRLPFNLSYQTFFHLIAARIATLLQSEVHRLELADAAARFRRLAEANPFGTVIGSLQGEIRYANPSFIKMLGYSDPEISSGRLRLEDLTPPRYAQADSHAAGQLRTLGRCAVYEKAYFTKDGAEVPVLQGAATIDSAGPNLEIAAFVTDLTPLKRAQSDLRLANEELEKRVTERTEALRLEVAERQKAEQGLRQLSGALLTLRDDEQRRIARDLHDSAGQLLTATTLSLAAATKDSPRMTSSGASALSEAADLVQKTMSEIRIVSHLLHPPLLDEAGLAPAIREYLEGYSKRGNVAVKFSVSDDFGRLPMEMETAIFRVVQECLTNIHRHSGSRTARVELSRGAREVIVEVADNGVGIDASKSPGVGLRGMRERVGQFGGQLDLRSDESGTTVTARWPLKRQPLKAV